MSNKNIVTGQLASITTYDSVTSQVEGVATDSVTANTVSLGTGNLTLSGNLISTTADTITIDPLGDGSPTGNLIVSGNMQVTGTLTYNDVVNATTTDLLWIAANDAASTSLATGAGLAVGPLGAYASFTYNSVANSWQSSLPLLSNGGVNANGALSGATTGSFSGNVTAPFFIGNGSALTGMYSNATAANYLPTYTGNLGNVGNITTVGNISAGFFIGDGGLLSNISGGGGSYSNANVASYLPIYTGNLVSLTGNVITTANITGGNLISNQDIFGTGILTLDQTFVDPAAVKMRIFVDGDSSFVQVGNGVGGSTGNIAFAPYFDGTGRVVINTGSGNLTAGNIVTTGNINGVNFNASGNAVITGNTSSGNLAVGNVATTGNIIMNGGKISGFSATAPATLQHYGETVVAGGNLTGTLAINTTLGTIQRYTLTGSITINGFVNAVAGTNATLILKQDATGGRTLTSTMKFLGGVKTLSTAANAIDVLSVFYDGTDYLATLGKGYA